MKPRFQIDDIVHVEGWDIIGKVKTIHLKTESGEIEYSVVGASGITFQEDRLSFYTGDDVTISKRVIEPVTRW